MSADNGIYILKTKDGYRVLHSQAIENIYWHWNDDRMYDDKFEEDYFRMSYDERKAKYPTIDGQQMSTINPRYVYQYFKDCTLHHTKKEALEEAVKIEEEIMSSSCPILEYGICFINDMENEDFPIHK